MTLKERIDIDLIAAGYSKGLPGREPRRGMPRAFSSVFTGFQSARGGRLVPVVAVTVVFSRTTQDAAEMDVESSVRETIRVLNRVSDCFPEQANVDVFYGADHVSFTLTCIGAQDA